MVWVLLCIMTGFVFFKQKTAYEMRISDWSSDVCSSDLLPPSRLVGIVEVAHALDPVHPCAQVARPGVLGGAGRDELALRALGVALRAQVDLGRQPRHCQVVVDLLLPARQRRLFGLRTRVGRGHRLLRARAADHARLGRRLWRRRDRKSQRLNSLMRSSYAVF